MEDPGLLLGGQGPRRAMHRTGGLAEGTLPLPQTAGPGARRRRRRPGRLGTLGALNLVLVGGFAALLVVSGAFNYKYLSGIAHRGANAPAGEPDDEAARLAVASAEEEEEAAEGDGGGGGAAGGGAASLLDELERAEGSAGAGAEERTDSLGRIRGDGGGNELADAAVLVLAFNRPQYLRQTLQTLASTPGLDEVSVYVSQDGNDVGVHGVAEALHLHFEPPKARKFAHWHHPRDHPVRPHQRGTAWLAQHYKWALDKIFHEHNHSHVIIVEDDMIFSEDFFHYFKATAVLLDVDETVWCVSSWNDQGFKDQDLDPRRLKRTSHFPGLGWMTSRAVWEELGPKFPTDHWDHWMRISTTSKGRDCIIPEVSRNFNIGERGGANVRADFYKKYIEPIQFNHESVRDFGDLSYLLNGVYEEATRQDIERARVLDNWIFSESLRAVKPGETVLVVYLDEDYKLLASRLHLFPEPRSHYRHVIRVQKRGVTYLLAHGRRCGYLPRHLQTLPDPTLEAVAAARNQNCFGTCQARQKVCEPKMFWFINDCETLSAHFPCEQGCAVVLGPDVPVYVSDPKRDTFQKCLINQVQPECLAQHGSTSRLCPCVAEAGD